MNSRNSYFDFLRGIAIMMVIAIHTVPVVPAYDSFYGITIITLRQMLNCAVPIFLAISGYFLAKKDLSSRNNIITFYKRQLPTVYIPCIVFSLGWFLLDLYGQRFSNPISCILNLIVCGYSIYYFIALIIQLYILLPLLVRWNKSYWGILISAIVSCASIVVVTYMLHIEGRQFPLVAYASPFAIWVVFFMMGIYFSSHKRSKLLIPGIVIATIGLIASVAETLYYLPLHGSGMGIKLSAFIYSAGVIMIIFSTQAETCFQENRATKCILWIGEVSFGIYLLHMYVRFALGYIVQTDSWLFSWLLTITLSSAIIIAAKRIVPSQTLTKYFGIR